MTHTKTQKRRCLAIKDDGTICGTILNWRHKDDICYACQHRVAYHLTTPKFGTLEEYLKQQAELKRGIRDNG